MKYLQNKLTQFFILIFLITLIIAIVIISPLLFLFTIFEKMIEFYKPTTKKKKSSILSGISVDQLLNVIKK